MISCKGIEKWNRLFTYKIVLTLVDSSSLLVWSAINRTPSIALCTSGQWCHECNACNPHVIRTPFPPFIWWVFFVCVTALFFPCKVADKSANKHPVIADVRVHGGDVVLWSLQELNVLASSSLEVFQIIAVHSQFFFLTSNFYCQVFFWYKLIVNCLLFCQILVIGSWKLKWLFNYLALRTMSYLGVNSSREPVLGNVSCRSWSLCAPYNPPESRSSSPLQVRTITRWCNAVVLLLKLQKIQQLKIVGVSLLSVLK